MYQKRTNGYQIKVVGHCETKKNWSDFLILDLVADLERGQS